MMAQPAPVVNRPPAAGSDQRTMMAQPAPAKSSAPDQRTMAVGAPAPQPVAQATQMLQDSQGVVAAFAAQERVQAARAASAPPEPAPSTSAGALFWLAWVIIGVGAGLGAHFWLASRAVQ
jgi:hypothetical protein